jgi:hypothetical protein
MQNKFKELAAPFPAEEVKERQSGGGMVQYLERQSYENRLDAVVGPENWQNKYQFGDDGAIVCYLGIKIDDEWIWKADGAPQTNIEKVKGGLTDSFKRACVRWGIARYLYDGKEQPVENGWGWKINLIEAVLLNTHIEQREKAMSFLENSGLSRKTTVKAVTKFAKTYQGKRDEGLKEADAYKFAQANWQKG